MLKKKEYWITHKEILGQFKDHNIYKKKVYGYPMVEKSKLYGVELMWRKFEDEGYIITDVVSGACVAWGKKLKYAKNQLSNLFHKWGKEEFIKEVIRCRKKYTPLDELEEFKEVLDE